MITRGSATIPDHILDPLFCFMRYTLMVALHLNKLAAGTRVNSVVRPVDGSAPANRKRIISRLSFGFSAAKRRCFRFSRLKAVLRGLNNNTFEEQIALLEAHVVVTCPTRRSVELSRSFSVNAETYLKTSCDYSNVDLAELRQNISLLTD